MQRTEKEDEHLYAENYSDRDSVKQKNTKLIKM